MDFFLDSSNLKFILIESMVNFKMVLTMSHLDVLMDKFSGSDEWFTCFMNTLFSLQEGVANKKILKKSSFSESRMLQFHGFGKDCHGFTISIGHIFKVVKLIISKIFKTLSMFRMNKDEIKCVLGSHYPS